MQGKFILLFIASYCTSFGSDFPIQKSGEVFGILASKGTAWIEVKEDDGFTHRYLSPWQGGSPTNGGGFDPKIIEKIGGLVVGNRIWFTWYWDGHLRVNKIRMIRPRKQNGVFAGYLLEKGENWFDARTEGGKIPWRFYVRWRGGLPENGGGYDTERLNFLNDVDPNLPIRFSWSYEFRPRFDKWIEEEEEEEFVPFYQGRSLGQSTDLPVPQPPRLNPFDQAPRPNPFDSVNPPANPFDSVNPPANPFDAVNPPANPFDQTPQPSPTDAVTPPVNPFDQAPQPNPFDVVNPPDNPFDQAPQPSPVDAVNPQVTPFDSAPKPPQNPFEQTPLPGNPFETLEKEDP